MSTDENPDASDENVLCASQNQDLTPPIDLKKLKDKQLSPSMRRKSFIIFFFLMTLNNLSYEVILCYSNDLAIRFDKENFMSAFSGCLVLFGLAIRMFNTKFLLRVRHRYKNWMVIAFFVMGVGLMMLADNLDIFELTLLGTIFFGIGTSLGDSTNVGFIKGLPPIVAAGHSSGSGLSGVIGSTFYLLLKIFNFSFQNVNIAMLFFYPIYGVVFWRAVCFKKEFDQMMMVAGESSEIETPLKEKENDNLREVPVDMKEPYMEIVNVSENEGERGEEGTALGNVEDRESKVNENLNWANLKMVLPKCYSLVLAYFMMYLLEYICNSWSTSRIVANYTCEYDANPPFYIEYGFELALVFYRTVLFVGRTTLSFFKCPRVWPLMIILGGMTFFYFCQSMLFAFFPIPIMFVSITMIAFVGGLLYCNIIYMTLRNPRLPRRQKEISLNLVVIMGDMGVLCSSLIGILVATFLYTPLNC